MNADSAISRVVMRRARIIHFLSTVISARSFALVLFVLALWGLGREVWVARVIENMPSPAHLAAFLRFGTSAFLNTEVLVQGLFIVAAITLVWFARECARLIALPSRALSY